jgi:hypothetical protein
LMTEQMLPKMLAKLQFVTLTEDILF